MTRNDNRQIGRRPVLKGAGAALAGVAGLASPVAAQGGNGNGGGNGGGKQPLEDTRSLTGAAIFQGAGAGSGFSYPNTPASLRFFDFGRLFDTTSAEITPNGQVIHYRLQFGVDSKPYVLTHEGDGEYTSRGSVINFELKEKNPLLGLFTPGEYRATVRDEVHLYEKGGSFDWSVTRTDFFTRPEMDYNHSAIIIVWDEDNADNMGTPSPKNDSDFRSDDADLGKTADYSRDALGAAVYDAMDSTAKRLIAAGPSNPGGQ